MDKAQSKVLCRDPHWGYSRDSSSSRPIPFLSLQMVYPFCFPFYTVVTPVTIQSASLLTKHNSCPFVVSVLHSCELQLPPTPYDCWENRLYKSHTFLSLLGYVLSFYREGLKRFFESENNRINGTTYLKRVLHLLSTAL